MDLIVKDSSSDFVRRYSRQDILMFVEGSTHLMACDPGRFASHPFLKFVLLSIKNRETSMSNTSFDISQMANEAALSKEQSQMLSLS